MFDFYWASNLNTSFGLYLPEVDSDSYTMRRFGTYTGEYNYVKFTNNTLYWYYYDSKATDAGLQFNANNYTYYYIIIG